MNGDLQNQGALQREISGWYYKTFSLFSLEGVRPPDVDDKPFLNKTDRIEQSLVFDRSGLEKLISIIDHGIELSGGYSEPTMILHLEAHLEE